MTNETLNKKVIALQDTDAGNAEAFELLHGDRFRYNHTSGKWMLWNGRHWAEDRDGEATRAALATTRRRLAAAITIEISKEMERRTKWALACEGVWRLEGLLRSARSLRSLATTAEQYDQHPFLLTVGNGTINLKTGSILPFRPDHLITRATDVCFDPNARAPRWAQFFNEIFDGDADLIEYIHRFIGYSLTGDTREQCFLILFGEGANGKSTFVETVCSLFGAHAETAEFSTLLARRDAGSPRNDLARLHAARFVKASEGEQEARLAESIIKELTGGDSITARFLYHEHFTFRPQFKIWLITNHKPEIRGTDDAIWRRVRLIPFRQQFIGKNRDNNLQRKLEKELPGILARAVRACLLWQKEGLGIAPRVEEATEKYRQESDQVGQFLAQRCERGRDLGIPAQRLYDVYVNWCRDEGEDIDAIKLFARTMEQHGITRKRTSRGVIYQGIGLVTGEPVSLLVFLDR